MGRIIFGIRVRAGCNRRSDAVETRKKFLDVKRCDFSYSIIYDKRQVTQMIESAGIAIVDLSTSEPCFLCVRAWSNWDFPKGKLEHGETHQQAAIREVGEEVTLFETVDYTIQNACAGLPVTYGKGKQQKTATYFTAIRKSKHEPFLPPDPVRGRPENDEWRWVPASELLELMPPRLQSISKALITWAASQQ